MPKSVDLTNAIQRITEMETLFDELLQIWKNTPASLYTDAAVKALLQKLLDYYEGGQWLRDFQMDELDLLPPDLKRGILSEDAVYDFLTEIEVCPK